MDTNNSNKAGIIGVIVAILVIIVGAGTYLYYNRAMAPTQSEIPEGEDTGMQFASNCGLTIDSPAVGADVSFPLTITGRINNSRADELGCAWTMFEGQAGLAELSYETKDGWSLPVDSKPIMVADWMTTETTFSVTLTYDNSVEQFPAGYNFKVVFSEEDPSGEGRGSRIELPVVLK
jgi:hypothetical protein